MPQVSQMFFKAAVIFLIFSLAVGLQMSISGEHKVTGAHSHASLLGWVTCAIFGAYYALNPAKAETWLAFIQFWVFVVSSAIMSVALYFLLLGYRVLVPVVTISSVLAFAGVILFAYLVFAPRTDGIPLGRYPT